MLNINLLPVNSKGEIDTVRWFTNRKLESRKSNLWYEFEEMLRGMNKKEIIDFIAKSDLSHTYYKAEWSKDIIIESVIACLNLMTGMLIIDSIPYGKKEEDRTWENIDAYLKQYGR